MSRVQLALRVPDLESSVAFYEKLFGVAPAKRRPGYANFAVEEPPLKLVLIEGDPDTATALDHLGVEVFNVEDVDAATARLQELGLLTATEQDTECCYALQDKVWVRGPGAEPWEVYVVKGHAERLDKADRLDKAATSACCAPASADQPESGQVRQPAGAGCC